MDAKPLNRQFDRNGGSKLALDWRVLGILNLYRVLVPLVLVSLYSLGGGRGLAVDSPRLFFSAAVFYLIFGLFSVIWCAIAWAPPICKPSCRRRSTSSF